MEQEWTPVNREFLECFVENVFKNVRRDVESDKYGYFQDWFADKVLEFVEAAEKAAKAEVENFCVKNKLS